MNHRRCVCVILCTVVVAGCAQQATCSITDYGSASADLRSLQLAAQLYHQDYGRYPVTDDSGTWFQKLSIYDDHNGPYITRSDTPADGYGVPYIYELPQGPDAPMRDDTMPILRWVGLNGIDDQGRGDDIDLRFGVNDGYYSKAGYPVARRTAAIGTLATLFAIPLLLCWIRSWALRVSVLALWSGAGIATVGLIGASGHDSWRPGGMYDALAVDGILIALAGFAGLVGIGTRRAIEAARRAAAARDTCCVNCGYDMRGSPGPVCPECGSATPLPAPVQPSLSRTAS